MGFYFPIVRLNSWTACLYRKALSPIIYMRDIYNVNICDSFSHFSYIVNYELWGNSNRDGSFPPNGIVHYGGLWAWILELLLSVTIFTRWAIPTLELPLSHLTIGQVSFSINFSELLIFYIVCILTNYIFSQKLFSNNVQRYGVLFRHK